MKPDMPPKFTACITFTEEDLQKVLKVLGRQLNEAQEAYTWALQQLVAFQGSDPPVQKAKRPALPKKSGARK